MSKEIIFKNWENAREAERRALQMNQSDTALKCADMAGYFEGLMQFVFGCTIGEYFLAR